TVQNGATLQIQGGIKIPDEALTLSGLGFNGNGVLHAVSGNNTISGPVTLLRGIGATQARIQVDAGSSLNFNQVVSGAADLIKTGGGTLLLTGTRSNTATGLVFVNAGTLALGKSAGLKAVGGNITVGDDSGGNSVDVLRLDSSDQIPDSLSILVNSSGLFNLNNF